MLDSKKRDRRHPSFGHILRAPKMISIDRSDKRSIIKIIKESKERIAQGRVIAMFPEGTRGKGNKLLKFQSGGKILAQKLNLKVQPVIITNTRKILDSQKFEAHSGEINVVFMKSVDPKENENWYEDLKNDMEKCLKNELANNTSDR